MMDRGSALTLGQMVDRAAARLPDREAIVFKRERVTCRGPGDGTGASSRRRGRALHQGHGRLRADQVLDVCLVGVPDPIMGEVVVAFARGRIANFKVPKYVEIVDRLPARSHAHAGGRSRERVRASSNTSSGTARNVATTSGSKCVPAASWIRARAACMVMAVE